jgi:excisionase family DNA binding protein
VNEVNPTNEPPATDAPPWAGELLELLRAILKALKTEQPREGGGPATEVKLLSLRDLSALSGFGVSTLEKMLAAGKLPEPLRFGRSVRFRRDDVESWLQGQPEAPENQPRSGRRTCS